MKGGDRVANGQDTFPQDGLPSRPSHFQKAENEYWTSLMSQIPNDMLRRVDAHQLSGLCEVLVLRDRLWSMMMAQPENLAVIPKFLQTCSAIARFSSLFGLSPLDRRRIKLAPPSDDDELDEWQ